MSCVTCGGAGFHRAACPRLVSDLRALTGLAVILAAVGLCVVMLGVSFGPGALGLGGLLGGMALGAVGLGVASRGAGPLTSPQRIIFTLVGSLVSAFGVVVLGAGVVYLRTAHLHRQKSGDGMRFAVSGAGILLGGMVALAGATWVVTLWRRAKGWRRRMAIGAGLATLAVVIGAAAFGAWVEGQGSRCIGTCG